MRQPLFMLALMWAATVSGQRAQLPPLPAPQSVPKPGPVTGAPYAPQRIVAGGVVVPLYPPGSPFLKMERVKEAEEYNMSGAVPGRISSIVNIHNPSIEVHTVDGQLNTDRRSFWWLGAGTTRSTWARRVRISCCFSTILV